MGIIATSQDAQETKLLVHGDAFDLRGLDLQKQGFHISLLRLQKLQCVVGNEVCALGSHEFLHDRICYYLQCIEKFRRYRDTDLTQDLFRNNNFAFIPLTPYQYFQPWEPSLLIEVVC